MKNQKKSLLLSELSLKEKIGQMFLVGTNKFDKKLIKLDIGGIFVGEFKSKEDCLFIKKYQENSKIKLFVAGDVEGWQTPFAKFYKSKAFGDIKDKREAYELGKEQGKIMKKLGFNFNFSPVVEIRNRVWPGRSFKGSLKKVKEKIKGYILGLRSEGILATAKHYPGGSMVKDPHKIRYRVRIYQKDIELFDEAIKTGVDAIMIGHPIVYGFINSQGKQSTISPEVIMPLRKKFKGIIITDNIAMNCLKISYSERFERVYVDLIKAGNDMILYSSNPSVPEIKKAIKEIEKAVKKGEISEKRIDESVKRILIKKDLIA